MSIVLVVDDDPIWRMLIEHQVNAHGHNAIVVEDGAGALELLGRQHVDLVLCDHEMAEMTGTEVRKSLGDDFNVPFVLITGHLTLDELDDVQGLADGDVAEILAKPFASQTLSEILSRWLPTHQDAAETGPSRAQG